LRKNLGPGWEEREGMKGPENARAYGDEKVGFKRSSKVNTRCPMRKGDFVDTIS